MWSACCAWCSTESSVAPLLVPAPGGAAPVARTGRCRSCCPHRALLAGQLLRLRRHTPHWRVTAPHLMPKCGPATDMVSFPGCHHDAHFPSELPLMRAPVPCCLWATALPDLRPLSLSSGLFSTAWPPAHHPCPVSAHAASPTHVWSSLRPTNLCPQRLPLSLLSCPPAHSCLILRPAPACQCTPPSDASRPQDPRNSLCFFLPRLPSHNQRPRSLCRTPPPALFVTPQPPAVFVAPHPRPPPCPHLTSSCPVSRRSPPRRHPYVASPGVCQSCPIPEIRSLPQTLFSPHIERQ